jgi:hypothetical protein
VAETPKPKPAPKPKAKKPGGCTGKGFQPGQSGNPGGRPAGQSLTARLRAILDEGDRAETLLWSLITAAIEGDVAAHRLIFKVCEPAGGGKESADVRDALMSQAEAMVEAKLNGRRAEPGDPGGVP